MKKRNIIAGSFFRVMQVVINIAISFYMMPFLIHNLGDKLYGFWALTSTIVTYYMMLDVNISTAVTTYISQAIGEEDIGKIQKIVSSSFFIYCVIGIIIFIATIMVMFSMNYLVKELEYIETFRTVVFILGISSIINLFSKVFYGAVNSFFRFDLLFYISFSTTVIRSISMIIFINMGYGVIAMAIIALLSSIYNFILHVVIYRTVSKLTLSKLLRYDKEYLKKIVRYSATAIIGVVADLLKFQMDNFVITGFIGLTAVTHYSIGSSLCRYLMDMVRNGLSVLSPLFSQMHGEKNISGIIGTLKFSLKACTIFTLFLAGGLIIFGSPFIEVWLGKSYSDSYIILVILVTSIATSMSQASGIRLLFATSQHKYYSWTNGIEGVLNLGLSIILVQYYGIVGVALGTAISMIFMRIVIFPYLISKACGITVKEYQNAYMPTLLKGSLIILLFYLGIKDSLVPDYKIIFAQSMLYVIIFLGCSLVFILDKTERVVLTGFLRNKISKAVS